MLCLIVDDSDVVRKVARRIFEAFHFTVEEAEDGAGAMAKCEETMPNLVLLDWHLPGLDALEFLGGLRKMDEGSRPKVIFCTSELDVAQIARAHRAGANDHMLKPFNRDLVEAKLHDLGVL
ncbi:MAG: response regulator [Alphaproteobacteria bacterium]